MRSVFLIVGEDGSILHLAGVKMAGREMTIPAVFITEDDALEVLYYAETKHSLTGHKVVNMGENAVVVTKK